MQFDDFYKTIGVFGSYQKIKYFLICLTYMLPPIMVYTWSFSAATPKFRCRTPMDNIPGFVVTNDTLDRYKPSESQCRQYQSTISIDECQRCYQIANQSDSNNMNMKACTEFIFDRTYFDSTLVEEVCLVFYSRNFLYLFNLLIVVYGLWSGISSKFCSNCFLLWLYDWFTYIWCFIR